MPKTDIIVINTSPLIALIAALGDLQVLPFLYLRAKKEGHLLFIKDCIQKMLNHQIRLSQTVIDFAIKQARE